MTMLLPPEKKHLVQYVAITKEGHANMVPVEIRMEYAHMLILSIVGTLLCMGIDLPEDVKRETAAMHFTQKCVLAH
jgi:hypothetical protein